jgi:solute carrier family 25 protein 38
MYKYTGIVHALRNIYTTEGLRGLTCGLLPTILRDAPFSGIYYMILMELKYYHHSGLSHTTNTFGSGIVAGILASVIIHPADVVKTKCVNTLKYFMPESFYFNDSF